MISSKYYSGIIPHFKKFEFEAQALQDNGDSKSIEDMLD